jgi:hypothetical protein
MAGSAKDDEDALQLVQESSQATGLEAEQVLADTAYGSLANRLAFQALEIDLVAKMAGLPERGFWSKDRFEIDWEAKTCKCPAGQVTANLIGKGRIREFRFDRLTCADCPLRAQCYTVKSKRGRQVEVREQEGVLVEARARQRSPDFQRLWRRRQVVEHRIARMVQLGMRKARYRGRRRTLFQALLTAAVANLTLVAGQGRLRDGVRRIETAIRAPWTSLHGHGGGFVQRIIRGRPSALQPATGSGSVFLRAAFRPDF